MKKLSVNLMVLTEEELDSIAHVQMMLNRISAETDICEQSQKLAEETSVNLDMILEDCIIEDDLGLVNLEDFLSEEIPLELIIDDEEEEKVF